MLVRAFSWSKALESLLHRRGRLVRGEPLVEFTVERRALWCSPLSERRPGARDRVGSPVRRREHGGGAASRQLADVAGGPHQVGLVYGCPRLMIRGLGPS